MQILNLSQYTLNPYERMVLEKGLSFCPDYQSKDFDFFLDLHRFTRKLTLTRHFAIKSGKSEKKIRRKLQMLQHLRQLGNERE